MYDHDSKKQLYAGSKTDEVKAEMLPVVSGNQALLQRMSSGNGIPLSLKSRVEQRSGISMDGVEVHYHSPRPAEVGALAYTQGNQVYLGPGQERHLAHELGHVVQQMQGRVKPTGSVKGYALNDDASLEREADSYRS